MNRRGFLSSLIAVPAAAWLAPNVLATSAPLATSYAFSNLKFKDIPITFNAACPNNTIYFMSSKGPYMLREGELINLSM